MVKKGVKNRGVDAVDSPLKYPGGKSYMLSFLSGVAPPRHSYDTLVEDYFGGGGFTLAHDPEGKSEIANDLNGELTNFWRTLQDEGLFGAFSRRLEATPFSAAEFERALCPLPDRPGEDPTVVDRVVMIRRAVAFFVANRQSAMGIGKSFAPLTTGRLRRGMNEQVSAWLTAVEGLPAVHARLKRVLVLNEDAAGLISRLDKPRVFHFADPTYLPETRVSKKLYKTEMSVADHESLLLTLQKVEHAQVMLCGYDSAMYRDALEGGATKWHRHLKTVPSAMSKTDGKAKPTRIEVVWTNYGADGRLIVRPPL